MCIVVDIASLCTFYKVPLNESHCTVSKLALILVQAVVQRLEDLQLVAQVRPREEVVLQLVPDLGQRPSLGTIRSIGTIRSLGTNRSIGTIGTIRWGIGVGLFKGVLILVVIAHKAVLVVELIAF